MAILAGTGGGTVAHSPSNPFPQLTHQPVPLVYPLTGGSQPLPAPTGGAAAGSGAADELARMRALEQLEGEDLSRISVGSADVFAQASPTATSSGGTSAGSGGSGGGGGGGGSAAAATIQTPTFGEFDTSGGGDWEATIEQARVAAEQQRAALESQYAADIADLRDLYNFSETPEERAAIAQRIAGLERQRDEGVAALAAGYAQAQADIRAQQGIQQQRARAEGDAVAQRFRDAAAALGLDDEILADRYGDQSVFANIGGATTANDMVAALLQAGAAREGNAVQRSADVRRADSAWLADTLSGESMAQQGDLRRLVQNQIGQAQAQHSQQVAARIQQERMQYAQQVMQVQQAMRDRGMAVSEREAELLLQLAGMQQSAGESEADRRLQLEMLDREFAQEVALTEAQMRQQAALAAAARRSGGGGGGSSSGGGMSPVEQRIFEANVMSDLGPTLGEYVLTGNGTVQDAMGRQGLSNVVGGIGQAVGGFFDRIFG